MYDIDTTQPSADFHTCWLAAARHLQGHAQGNLNWLKADLTPPQIEHLSFRMGNQIFFIRVEDVSERVHGPSRLDALIGLATESQGIPCILRMKKGWLGKAWVAEGRDWGLTHAVTQQVVTPPALVTDENIEMSDWELHDMAVQVVRDNLKGEGHEIMSFCSNASVSPSIWFKDNGKPCWVIVRAARYPEDLPDMPDDIAQVAARCRRMSQTGYFAPVVVASAEETFIPDTQPASLWRGHGMHIKYKGLVRYT